MTLIARDVATLGLLRDTMLRRWAETEDPELASKIGTLIANRRSGLKEFGLHEQAEGATLSRPMRAPPSH